MKSQVQILPPRLTFSKLGGIEYHGYEFWVGSWMGGFGGPTWRWLVNPRQTRSPEFISHLFDLLVDIQAAGFGVMRAAWKTRGWQITSAP
jgi:hypothetical protein